MGYKPTVATLEVADDPQCWRDVGFAVDDDGNCQIGTVRLHLKPINDLRGVQTWSVLTDTCPPGEYTINGLSTTVIKPEAIELEVPVHPNGTLTIDHLVVFSPNLAVTIAALSDLGLEPRRTREHEAFGQPMRQVFFRMGEVVLELVGPDKDEGEGNAGFFGLAFTVVDLDATASFLGEHVGRTKNAVQPGRRITTLRKTAGLQTAVAFMTGESD